MRKPLEIPALTAAEAEALDTLYRTTRDVRLRTRAQMVLLAAEQRLAQSLAGLHLIAFAVLMAARLVRLLAQSA